MSALRDVTAFACGLLLSLLLLVPFMLQEARAAVGFTMTHGYPDGKYVRFSQVPTNVQADITNELGAFRCSQPGLYHFSFTAMAPSRESCRISLRRNRVPVVTAYASDNGFSWTSSGAVLYLAHNDLVYLYLEEGTLHESKTARRAYTSFSGFLVGDEMLMGRNPPAVDATEGPLPPADPYDDIFSHMSRLKAAQNTTDAAPSSS